MKSYWSRLLSLVLVLVIGLVGCGGSPDSLTGDYRQDTLAVVNTLRQALELPQDSPNKAALQAEARQKINDFSARYQRNTSANLSYKTCLDFDRTPPATPFSSNICNASSLQSKLAIATLFF